MEKSFIEKVVNIKAPVENVWRVFTEPAITRKTGGEYITDWQKGSTLNWKGVDGNIHTHGVILQIEPRKLLRHNLLSSDKQRRIMSVITYRFHQVNQLTTVYAREEFNSPLQDSEYTEAVQGWDKALKAVKETAESLQPL